MNIFYNPNPNHRKLDKGLQFKFTQELEENITSTFNIQPPHLKIKFTKKANNTIFSVSHQDSEIKNEIEKYLIQNGMKILPKNNKLYTYVLKHYPIDKSLDSLEQRIREYGDDIYLERMTAYNSKTKSRNSSTLIKLIANFEIKEKKITAGDNILLQCEKFREPPLICYNCQSHGHYAFNRITKVKCNRDTVCGKCAQSHKTNTCNAMIKKCANCSGNHIVSNPICPEWNKTNKNKDQSHNLNSHEFPSLPSSPAKATSTTSPPTSPNKTIGDSYRNAVLFNKQSIHEAVNKILKINEQQLKQQEEIQLEILNLKNKITDQKKEYEQKIAELEFKVDELHEENKTLKLRIELEKIIKDGKVNNPERHNKSNVCSENISMQDNVKPNEDKTLEMSNLDSTIVEESLYSTATTTGNTEYNSAAEEEEEDLYSTAPTTGNTEYNSAAEEEEENEVEVFFNGIQDV